MHLCIRVDGVYPVDPTYWCVGFHGAREALHHPRSDGSDVGEHDDVPDRPVKARNGRVQEAMLTDSVQVVPDPQRVRPEAVPSLVRLQPLDGCLSAWVSSLGFVQPAPSSRKSLVGSPVEQSASNASRSLAVFIPEDGNSELSATSSGSGCVKATASA